jgi:hypothetical protein
MSIQSEYTISGLPNGKDLTNCSNEELGNLAIAKNDGQISLNDYDFSDGKDRNEKQDEIKKIKDLEMLLGISQANPFRTLNKGVFQEFLSTASVAEMTDLALRVGVTPNRTPSLLKKSLSQAFAMYVQKHDVTVGGQMKPLLDRSSPDYEKVVKLFGE